MNPTFMWMTILILILIGMTITAGYLIKQKKPLQTYFWIIGIFLIVLILSIGKVWWETNQTQSTPDNHEYPPNEQNDGVPDDDNEQNNEKPEDDVNDKNDEENPHQEEPGEKPREDSTKEPNEEQPNDDNGNNSDEQEPTPDDSSMEEYYDEESKTYMVQKGDTLWAISQFFKVTIDQLRYWNELEDNTIKTGQQLKVNGPPIEQPPTTPPNPTEPSIFITHGDLNQKEIALTFDAGSDVGGINILDVLKKHNVKSTFFLTGRWVELFPDHAKILVQDGHEIANHSYAHEDFTQIGHQERLRSIQKTDDAIRNIMGIDPMPYFRFPYGAYNNSALQSVGEAGYMYSIQWSIDTIDWQQPDVETISTRILENASNGDIILMHIGAINTPQAVDYIIPILKEQGYRFVTISEILN